MKPTFIDNQEGNTLSSAIKNHLKALRDKNITPNEICISTAFFNPQGFERILSEIKHISKVKLLLGAEPTPEAYRKHRMPGDPKEPLLTAREIEKSLKRLLEGINTDRDFLSYTPVVNNAISKLIEFLKSDQIEVKRYTGNFLHAKAYLFRGNERGLISGSSNLTYAGMERNLELNLGHYEDPLLEEVEKWYDDLWEKAEDFDLAELYALLFELSDPYFVYLMVLWQLYGQEISSEEDAMGDIPVTTFQKHGIFRAKTILDKFGGVLVADGVGLGKTFTAGGLIEEYRDRRQRVLLICPATLRDSEWKKFIHKYQLLIESVSYEQLANDVQLGGEKQHLQCSVDEYALIVVDEAHNYRNPMAPTRAGIFRKLTRGKRKDLLFLTATPVNNSLWDLYHLLSFFLKQDAVLSDVGIRSLRERFTHAMSLDPYNLDPDLLYPVIDATTVKRTRKFIKKHYYNDRIKDHDGNLVPITFPKPKALSIRYSLDQFLPGFFNRFQDMLMPVEGDPLLKMARYKPENYNKGAKKGSRYADSVFVGLLRSIMLKRFESSIYAFQKTISRMVDEHQIFIDAINEGKIVTTEFIHEFASSDDDISMEDLLKLMPEITEPATDYDVKDLIDDVESDKNLLAEMLAEISGIDIDNTPKLKALHSELVKIAKQSKSDSIDDDTERQNRKVLIFSFYSDTIDWIEKYVLHAIDEDPELSTYKDRVASVSGTESRSGITRIQAMHGFAPKSTQAPEGMEEDKYDIVMSTDVLAEGVNLQQCRNIINIDLPWNPMRLIQRHGRIDRINSQHKEVFLRTFFPDEELDALLNLEERVRNKLAQAAASIGVEDTPIEKGASGGQSFTNTREDIEKLATEDASIYESGGTGASAQTGEEYRQELRIALEKYGDKIEKLPWKLGSIMKGQDPGYFFCAKVGHRIYLRFVPNDEKDIIREIGTCLRIIECSESTDKIESDDIVKGSYLAWEKARDHIYDDWQFETDPANLQPKIRKLNREVAEYLRDNPPEEIEQSMFNNYLDIVEAPWPRRDENQLRKVYKEEYNNKSSRTSALIEVIKNSGIEPLIIKDPLDPIELDDVHLLCWLGIEGADA